MKDKYLENALKAQAESRRLNRRYQSVLDKGQALSVWEALRLTLEQEPQEPRKSEALPEYLGKIIQRQKLERQRVLEGRKK